ncbi:MAG: ferredoxin [Deltaproteobacteria bacterium RIFOXYA12_FULL_61_11]|nr:MAG: ferredoxin [Deltaproteobacteria bacterium RIFOXYA12_FULL_61_11]
MTIHRNPVDDPGFERGLQKLTPERLSAVVHQVLDTEAAARLKIYLATCVHCGLCSEACHWYLSNRKDPEYSPVGKVKETMAKLVELRDTVTHDDLRAMARIAFTECNVCRRCSMYCPFGIDIAYLLLTIRRFCHLLGIVPLYLQDTVNSHSAAYNQMWVGQNDWIDTLLWQEEEAQSEVPSAAIPLEREGADIMYSVIAPEPKILAQLIGNMAQIMAVAGMSWTMPATDGWDNSNMAMFSGDFEIMGRVERLHWDTALRLKVKRVVMGECGHAFRGSAYDGPKWLGWLHPPIPMVHAVDFYHELITSGRIRIAKKIKGPITLQEPCNIVRGLGLGEKLRFLMNAVCEDFRDVEPNREHNYCCAAGGGVINCGPIWKAERVRGNKEKAKQLAATGATTVITPCHNCHSGIEDIVGHYKLGMHVKFFSDLLLEAMEIPDELRG